MEILEVASSRLAAYCSRKTDLFLLIEQFDELPSLLLLFSHPLNILCKGKFPRLPNTTRERVRNVGQEHAGQRSCLYRGLTTDVN